LARRRMAMAVRGIIHVGASVGQEAKEYARLNVPVLWFEPLPAAFAKLKANIAPYHQMRAVNVALGDSDGIIPFYESSKGGVSSSPLKPTRHLRQWPDRTFTPTQCQQRTLDSYMNKAGQEYNLLVLDVQGYELAVLRGATDTLKHIDEVRVEVWYRRHYEGSALKHEVDVFLALRGFDASEEKVVVPGVYGEATYRRRLAA
jgi:FkbM family methyltransferase